MTTLKTALGQSGAINISEILTDSFCNNVRLDYTLRSIFDRKPPNTKSRRDSCSDAFTLWMHRYNEGRKSVNHYAVPDYTLPTELVSCATVLGYKGREEFLPAWEYLRYLLEEKGLSEFVDHDKPEPTIRHLVASTLALVQGIIEIDNSNNANQVRELQLRQILKALGIDGRGLSRSKNDRIKSMIRRAMNELNGGDSSRWNQDEIVRIAESIVRGIQ